LREHRLTGRDRSRRETTALSKEAEILKLLLCGKGLAIVRAAEYVLDLAAALDRGLHLSICPVRSDTGANPGTPSLLAYARKEAVEVVEDLFAASLGPSDVLYSIQFDKRIRRAALRGARGYNLHFSLLPKYRGCHASVLPIREGASETGVTLHVLGEEFDCGPVIAQRRFTVPRFYTAADLYERCHLEAYELFKETLPAVLAGTTNAVEQDESQATYHRRADVDYQDVEIRDFSRTAESVVNHVRSLISPAYQLPTYRGRPVGRCEPIFWSGTNLDAYSIGQEILHDEAHAVVRCVDSLVRLVFVEAGRKERTDCAS